MQAWAFGCIGRSPRGDNRSVEVGRVMGSNPILCAWSIEANGSTSGLARYGSQPLSAITVRLRHETHSLGGKTLGKKGQGKATTSGWTNPVGKVVGLVD